MKPRKIILIGSSSDGTFLYVYERVKESDADAQVIWIEPLLYEGSFYYSSEEQSIIVGDGRGREITICRDDAIYCRPFDFYDPSIQWTQGIDTKRLDLLNAIHSLTATVVPRTLADGGNDSKPYQLSLLGAHGFTVPRGVATNSPDEARRFIESCPQGVIYKSTSGTRSIVERLNYEKALSLDLIFDCPVFFQECIAGPDVRLHMVAELGFAEEILVSCIDYRYAAPEQRTFSPHTVPTSILKFAVSFMRETGNTFMGFDFKVDSNTGEYFCLEANPNPGFEGYDVRAGGVISEALINLLQHGSEISA